MAPRKDFAAMESRRASGDNAARAALRSRMAHPTSLRLDELQPNPLNPRYQDEDPEVRQLANTLRRVGQLQPAVIVSRAQYLTAYPDQTTNLGPQEWIVLVGNRRLAASILAGRPTLDVRVAEDLDTPEAFEDRILIENVQRKDLPPLLEAEHLQRRLSRPGQTMRTVAEAIGKSHTYVAQRLDLLKLIPEFQELLRRGELNLKTGRLLGAMATPEQQARLAGGPPYLDLAPDPSRVEVPATSVNPVYSTEPQPPASEQPASEPAPAAPSLERTVPPPDHGNSDSTAIAPANPDASEPAATSKNHIARREREHLQDAEQIRLSVVERLDSALAELDTVLPGDDESPLSSSLAESQRHIIAARRALASQPMTS